MTLVRELLLLAVVFSITGSVVVLADGSDPAFNSFIASLVNGFHQLAAGHPNGTQFSILVLLTQEQIQQWDAMYHPPINFPGHNTTNSSLIPPDPAQYGNYLLAYADFQCQPVSTCKAQLLDHLDRLYDAFTKHGNTVAAIVLYTHFLPCESCTRAIRDTLELYDDPRRIVVFKSSENASFVNLAFAQKVFAESNIGLHQFCRGSSNSKLKMDRREERVEIPSFQSFIMDCLSHSKASGFTSADYAVSDLVNMVMDQCRNQLNNLETCSWDALDDLIGPA